MLQKKRYHPKFSTYSRVFLGIAEDGKCHETYVGSVVEPGLVLPSGRDLFGCFDKSGRINLLVFFSDHQEMFPLLWIIAQREASRRVVEVGCECF